VTHLIQNIFSEDDQITFAKLSGDYNPVHIDPLKARRISFGQPVVHGINLLLWALDSLVSDNLKSLQLLSLKSSFTRFIGIGETVQFLLKTKNEKSAEIQLISKKEQVARIFVSYAPSKIDEFLYFPDFHPARGECKDRTIQQLSNASGCLDLCLHQKEASRQFPNLLRVFPSSQLAELFALTRLIGMECPGLHSIFSDLDLNFLKQANNDSPKLNYEVTSCDYRIRLLTQNVSAPGMSGTLRAFLRYPLQHQESYLELSNKVKKQEFLGQTALIIGGSRGLGEVTGKLLAAGGANVAISYYLGSEEACSIVKQIKQDGGNAICFPFDVLSPRFLKEENIESRGSITHFYYFATPMISLGSRHSFSQPMFEKFCNYYVSGFFNTFQLICSDGNKLQGIFYPSSVAISDLPSNMAEYVAAKSSGEALCDLLRKNNPDINIYSPRLPQAATDQMAFLLPVFKEDPATLMLENLRIFHDKRKPNFRPF
jgi:NADP-dependent 3-hydroxy acid dehydrogenase YdfG